MPRALNNDRDWPRPYGVGLAAVVALALIAAPAQDLAPIPALSPRGVAELLGELGYSYRATHPDGTSGELAKAGRSVGLWMTIPPRPRGDAESPVVVELNLRQEYALGRPLDPARLREWRPRPTRSESTLFQARIDHTASATKAIRFFPGITRGRLRAQIEGFWSDLKAFEEAFVLSGKGRPLRPGEPAPPSSLDLDQTATRLDERDIDTLLRTWGWTAAQPWTGERTLPFGTSWLRTIEVEGTILWLTPVSRAVWRGTPTSRLRISREIAVWSVKDVDEWVRRTGQEIGWGVVRPTGQGQVFVDGFINLEGGLKLRDMREQIVEFARRAEALARQTRGSV